MAFSLSRASTMATLDPISHPDGTLPIEPPLSIDNPDGYNWDRRCDVLVVGFGAAGAAAAIVAREGGAGVIVADRFDGGGASAKSGGIVYAGGGTAHQKRAGYDDTPEEMFKYLRQETGDAVSDRALRTFCEDSRYLIKWLETLGANFESSVPPPKTSYPKDGVYLYYSGNEAVPAYAEHAKPAPRGHRTRGSWLSGKAMFEFMRARVKALSIPVLTQTAARRLIVDSLTGQILGAELWQLPPDSAAAKQYTKWMNQADTWHNFSARRADALRAKALALELREAKPLRVRAMNGVILATGGFIFNREMLRQHAPKYLANMRLGTTGCDGSGIRLGQSVGGVPARLDKVSAWRFINPPTAWPSGIVVDQKGERFCNEQVYGAKLGGQMCEHHDGKGWLILDRRSRWAAIREALFGKLWPFQSIPALILMLFAPRASSIDGLALKMSFPTQSLKATVDSYNQAVKGAIPDAQGKDKPYLAPIDKPPFYAMDISAGSSTFPCPAITLGGLKVDEDSGAVLDAAGKPIKGLFAAGRTAIGVASNNYVSGLSLADCLWSGRRAGAALVADGATVVVRKMA